MEVEAVRLFESSSDRGEDSSGPSEMAGSSVDLEVSDTETFDSRADSEFGGDELEADSSGNEDDVPMPVPRPVLLIVALESLDELHIPSTFEKRGAVMKSIPKFLRGPFRNALKFPLRSVRCCLCSCTVSWRMCRVEGEIGGEIRDFRSRPVGPVDPSQ